MWRLDKCLCRWWMLTAHVVCRCVKPVIYAVLVHQTLETEGDSSADTRRAGPHEPGVLHTLPGTLRYVYTPQNERVLVRACLYHPVVVNFRKKIEAVRSSLNRAAVAPGNTHNIVQCLCWDFSFRFYFVHPAVHKITDTGDETKEQQSEFGDSKAKTRVGK